MTVRRNGVAEIHSILRAVPDVAAAVAFYMDALDSVPDGPVVSLSMAERALLGVVDGEVLCQPLGLGRQRVTLLQFDPPGRPYPPGSTSTDLWFQHCAVVVRDMERAHAQVMAAGALTISVDPQRLPPSTGGVTAFKFRDPAGHPLELLSLPEGIGDPTWHEGNLHLFMGIDHTAISVSDPEVSRSFYADMLGLRVDARTLNRGLAQTRLDAVPNDVVDVIALVPGRVPPHLELLGYRTGTRRRGAAGPADASASRTLASGDIEAIAARLTRHGHALRRGTWNMRSAIAFEDPDGHAWICYDA